MRGGEVPSRGSVDRSQVRHVAQHELDTANRLASLGFNIAFRQPKDESTADAYVNGVLADDKQGPRFVVDVSASALAIDEVAPAMQRLCDRYPDKIATAMVVDQMTMRIVGEEVPQWRL